MSQDEEAQLKRDALKNLHFSWVGKGMYYLGMMEWESSPTQEHPYPYLIKRRWHPFWWFLAPMFFLVVFVSGGLSAMMGFSMFYFRKKV